MLFSMSEGLPARDISAAFVFEVVSGRAPFQARWDLKRFPADKISFLASGHKERMSAERINCQSLEVKAMEAPTFKHNLTNLNEQSISTNDDETDYT